MNLPGIVVGAVLLLFGRGLFWVFVGAAGFIAGVVLARDVLAPQPDWIVLVVGVLAGIVGAVLAVLLQRIAVAVAGFLFGGFLLQNLALAAGYPDWSWIAYLAGGVAAAVLVMILFDPALIVLSSLAGATLLAQSIDGGPTVTALVFAGGLVVGLAVQLAQLRASTPT